jgi:hypothetical protein
MHARGSWEISMGDSGPGVVASCVRAARGEHVARRVNAVERAIVRRQGLFSGDFIGFLS